MTRLIKLLTILIIVGITGCTDDPIPKPVGYFRIELPPDTFAITDFDCPYAFEKHAFTMVRKKRQDCWVDIHYPSLRAMIQITYKPIENDNLDTLLNDMHNLVFRHTVKADGIEEKQFFNDQTKTYGTLYKLHGDAATHTQFFITDSINHFLRGVVYFDAVPNEDSLKPVNQYMYDQAIRLMETVTWQD